MKRKKEKNVSGGLHCYVEGSKGGVGDLGRAQSNDFTKIVASTLS